MPEAAQATQPVQHSNKIKRLIVWGLLLGLAGLAWAAFVKIRVKARIMHGSVCVRRIQHCIKGWAGDHNGMYPDADPSQPKTSNDAFRVLFRAGLLSSENDRSDDGSRGFGCPVSPYIPDNVIGTAPDYLEALKPGECHWSMTKGLRDDSSSDFPLVFENTAGRSWPPTWDCDAAGTPAPGRAWPGGRIIIGRNDGSIQAEQLASDKGSHVELAKDKDGLDIFTRWQRHGEYLDIARP